MKESLQCIVYIALGQPAVYYIARQIKPDKLIAITVDVNL